MHERFAAVVESLQPAFGRLIGMTPIAAGGRLPIDMPQCGVYLFSEGERHLYVGRSNHLRNRFGQHRRRGAQHNQADLAFRIARETTGMVNPAYVSGPESRVGLSKNGEFATAFLAAKIRVQNMDYRYVGEGDQTRQALLEMYCAISLGCPYNDFNTH